MLLAQLGELVVSVELFDLFLDGAHVLDARSLWSVGGSLGLLGIGGGKVLCSLPLLGGRVGEQKC